MRRAAPAAGIVALIVAILAFGLIRWPISPALVGDSLNGASGSTRLHWAMPDAASFRALPWPSVRFYGARLDASGATLLTAPEARLDLAVGELLRGRFVAKRAALTSPIITIDLSARVFAAQDRLGQLLNARTAVASLANVSLANGVVRIVDARHDFDTVIDDVQGRLDGLGLASRLQVNLSAIWRETPIVLSGSLEGVDKAAVGEGASLNLALASPVGNLLFAGSVVGGALPSVSGGLTFSARGLSEFTRFVGLQRSAYLATDDVSLTATVKGTVSDLTLDDATVAAAGQTLQGSLRIADFRGHKVISGTLDADRLVVGALFASPPPLSAADGQWSRQPFAIMPFKPLDVDLRLSAGMLDLYGHPLANAAASVMVKDGELTASLIEATAYGGKVEGEARLVCVEDELDLHARARISDADLGAALTDFGWTGFAGHATADLALASRGSSPAAMIARMSGTTALRAQEGSVDGANLEEGLRRARLRPLDVPHDLRAGQTAFDTLALETLIGGGVAHFVKGELIAQGVIASLGGSVDLVNRNLDLSIAATQTDTSGEPSASAAGITLDIVGPWSSPAIRARSGPRPPDRAAPSP